MFYKHGYCLSNWNPLVPDTKMDSNWTRCLCVLHMFSNLSNIISSIKNFSAVPSLVLSPLNDFRSSSWNQRSQYLSLYQMNMEYSQFLFFFLVAPSFGWSASVWDYFTNPQNHSFQGGNTIDCQCSIIPKSCLAILLHVGKIGRQITRTFFSAIFSTLSAQ